MPSRLRTILGCAALLVLSVDAAHAQDTRQDIKPPIRGLVSMGAYRFVGYGGDPVNTLEPLNAKPGIFGGLVVIASWKQLQPTPQSEIGPNNVIDRALAEVRAYNERNPQKPLAVKLRVWGGCEPPASPTPRTRSASRTPSSTTRPGRNRAWCCRSIPCAPGRGRAMAIRPSPKASCATAAGRSDGAACSTTTISIPTCPGRSIGSTPR